MMVQLAPCPDHDLSPWGCLTFSEKDPESYLSEAAQAPLGSERVSKRLWDGPGWGWTAPGVSDGAAAGPFLPSIVSTNTLAFRLDFRHGRGHLALNAIGCRQICVQSLLCERAVGVHRLKHNPSRTGCKVQKG